MVSRWRLRTQTKAIKKACSVWEFAKSFRIPINCWRWRPFFWSWFLPNGCWRKVGFASVTVVFLPYSHMAQACHRVAPKSYRPPKHCRGCHQTAPALSTEQHPQELASSSPTDPNPWRLLVQPGFQPLLFVTSAWLLTSTAQGGTLTL